MRFSVLPSFVALATVVAASCAPPTPGEDAGPVGGIDCSFATDDSCPAGDERPQRRSEMAAAYDEANARMVIFGGTLEIATACAVPTYTYISETWAFNDRCGTWTQIGGQQPPPRGRHSMALDKERNRALLFGGRTRGGTGYALYNDLWVFDFDTDTWSQAGAGGGPSARTNTSFVVDDEGGKAYLFGGDISTSGLSYNAQQDLWELDLSSLAWTQLTPTGTAPSPRLWMGSLFDPQRRRFIVYAGDDNDAFTGTDSLGDMFAYDVEDNAWIQLHDGTGDAPAGRFRSQMAYDDVNDRYLMFGGHDDTQLGNTNDMWAFNPNDFTWESLQIGDTYNRPAFNQCDFPADFSNVDMTAPERRGAGAAVWSSRAACPGFLTSMGKTDCGATDDVWRWRVDLDEWEELEVARQGEMCIRADRGFDCTEMCE